MGSLLSNIVTIAKGVSTVSGAFSSAINLWETLEGDTGMDEVADAIQNMAAEMQQGFQSLAAAVNMGTLVNEWAPTASALNSIQATHAQLQEEFATLSTTTWMVSVSAQAVTFRSWCEGHDGKSGALETLSNCVMQLGNLFMTGGVANNSVISLWDQLCSAAAANKIGGFTQQTRYNLMFQFMQEIFATLGALFYTRENALALYLSQYPPNPYGYETLPATIQQIFGNVNTKNTVWYQFAQQFATYTAPSTADGQFAMAATSGDSYPTDSYVCLDGDSLEDYTLVLMHPVSAPANQFFGSIGIQTAQITIGAQKQVMYLVGTPVTIGPDLTFTPQAQVTAFNASAQYQPFTDLMAITGGSPDDGMSFSYINTCWAPPPAVANSNQCAVVTGFKFATVGNRMGVSLQYGILDISNPNNPVLTTNPAWVGPTWGPTFFAVQGWDNWGVNVNYIDQRPAGTADYFPGTNLALIQTFGTGSGNRIGVALQSAWSAFAANFFQPSEAYAKSPTITPAAEKAA